MQSACNRGAYIVGVMRYRRLPVQVKIPEMTKVADKTLPLFSTFAHTQWHVDERARHCAGIDEAVKAALETVI